MKFPFVPSNQPLPKDQQEYLDATQGFPPNPMSLAIYAQSCLTSIKGAIELGQLPRQVSLQHLDDALEDLVRALIIGNYVPPDGVKWKQWPW